MAVPIDGQWQSASGGHFCSVLNVSLGGCFARSPTVPGETESTAMTMYFGKHGPLTIKGKVVYGAPKGGFGFQFDQMHHELKIQLGQHLQSLKMGDY